MNDRLAKENIGKLILQFSVPAIIGQVVFALYNIVDRMFIGQTLGTLAISSISVTLPLFTIMIAFGMLVGIGASSRVSISLGEGRKEWAERVLGNAIFLFAVISVMIMFVGYIFMDEVLLAVGATESMLGMASSYMHIIYAAVFFNFMAFGVNSIIRAEGSPRTAMYIMLSGAILNIFLDYIFVIVLGYGIEGAAWATVMSNILSACCTMYHFSFAKDRRISLHLNYIKPKLVIIKNILAIGSSGFILQLGASLAAVFANAALLKYGGEDAIGAMGVINSFYLFVMMVNVGIGQGTQPLVGFNYGHKSYERVRGILRYSLIAGTLISLLAFIPIITMPDSLVSLFTDGDISFINLASRGMILFLMGMPLLGYNTIGSGYFQAVGKSKEAGILFFMKQIVIYISCLLILPLFWGLDGVFLSGAVSELLLFAVLTLFITREVNSLRFMEKDVELKTVRIDE